MTGAFLVVLLLCIVWFALEIVRRFIHLAHLNSIPIRIIVNGTRGKSSVTRLIASVLREHGFTVIARTTGTAARHIYADGSEKPIRRIGTSRIGEIIDTVSLACKCHADVLVVECMALQPEYQKVLRDILLRPTIGVLTNVREDHLEIVGPSLSNAAKNLCLSLPKNGKWVMLPDDRFTNSFQQFADSVGSTITYAPEILDVYSHSFIDNSRLVLAVSDLLHVDNDVVRLGISHTVSDPGAFSVGIQTTLQGSIAVINAFSANDPESTDLIIEKHLQPEWETLPHIYVYNNRSDRINRALTFCPYLVQKAQMSQTVRIVLLGLSTGIMYRKLLHMGVQKNKILRIRFIGSRSPLYKLQRNGTPTELFINGLDFKGDSSVSAVIIGIGNSAGNGELCSESWKSEAVYA